MAGRIRLAGLTPGTYVLSTRTPGFKALQHTLTVLPNQMVGVRLTVQVGSPPYSGDPSPYSAPLLTTETSSLYALIPEVTLPAPPQPALRQESSRHNRFQRFFSALGHKLGP